MENPQETKIKQLKWLGGFFDAEGSISFNYKPNIDVVNTHVKTIFHTKLILNSVGISFNIIEREKSSKNSKKKRWDISLKHEEQTRIFLDYFSQYIFGKKKQIEIIEEWFKKKENPLYYKRKIMFCNQLNNIVVSSNKIDVVKEKLRTNNLREYEDIKMLDEEKDGIIETYSDFNSVEYIAGLIDGDGCFVIRFFCTNGKNVYTPVVIIVNTNKEIIRRCCSVLKNNNVGYFITFKVANKTTNRKRWDIVISGVKRCSKLCDLLKNDLITKKEQCEVMLNYCNYRLNNEKSNKDTIGYEAKKALEELKK